MRRTAVTVAMTLAALVALVAGAAPASAHTVSGVGATNFVTSLQRVTPSVDGVRVRVVEAGSRLELTNSTGTDAIVLGYQDEPYLRVGPSGVFRNKRSPATYLNATRKGTTPVPDDADPAAAPEWVRIASGPVARWHDHRIHWMGRGDPPQVRAAPGRRHVVIPEWKVQIRYGDRTIAATGSLTWVPGPSPVPWVAAIVVIVALLCVAGASRLWGPVLGGAVGLLVVVDVVHMVGLAWATSSTLGAHVGRLFGQGLYSMIFWVVGAASAVAVVRRREFALFPAAIAGFFLALAGGLTDVALLFRTTAPFPWPVSLARVLVAVTVALGLGGAAGCAVALWRTGAFSSLTTEDDGEGVPA